MHQNLPTLAEVTYDRLPVFMKIVIATPLYPPDIEPVAVYTKELARRLSKNHEVTVVAYSHIPEQIPGVAIISIEKNLPLVVRLVKFTRALLRLSGRTDIYFIENGSSVELPVLFLRIATGAKIIMHLGDEAAHKWSKTKKVRGYIEYLSFKAAKKVLAESPLEKPEILPFEPFPTMTLKTYEESWTQHLAVLEKTFHE